MCGTLLVNMYYNNHHHFLSARSIFPVVWKVTEQDDAQLGLNGLEFWLKSLKAHLPVATLPPVVDHSTTTPAAAGTMSKPLYTIIIVGTHIDQLQGNSEESRAGRAQKVKSLFETTCEMGPLPFEYVEVSSTSGAKMGELYSHLLTTALVTLTWVSRSHQII